METDEVHKMHDENHKGNLHSENTFLCCESLRIEVEL